MGEALTASDGTRLTRERKNHSRDDNRKRSNKCYICGKNGHMARECRSKGGRHDGAGGSGTADYAMLAVSVNAPDDGDAMDDDDNDGLAFSAAITHSDEWVVER